MTRSAICRKARGNNREIGNFFFLRYRRHTQMGLIFDKCACETLPREEEIAATVAFLVSTGAGYITGQNIRVDGGLMRGV